MIGVMNKCRPCPICGSMTEGTFCLGCWEKMMSPEAKKEYERRWNKFNKEYFKEDKAAEKLYRLRVA